MPHTSSPATGHLNYWVAIDVAAAALDVSPRRAYELARSEGWRRTPTRPRGYLMQDIRSTRIRMKAMNND